jgi:hypothetical protein
MAKIQKQANRTEGIRKKNGWKIGNNSNGSNERKYERQVIQNSQEVRSEK